MTTRRQVPVGLVSVVVALAAASGASAQTPPDLPSLPDLPAEDSERFALTVSGTQSSRMDFTWNPTPDAECPWLADGRLTESWDFKRGKRVVMVFSRLGAGLVVVGREGRSLGDAAFATQGKLVRTVAGSGQLINPPTACPVTPLTTPACDRTYAAPADLRLDWEKGRLVLEAASTENTFANPALGCGETTVLNFGQALRAPYPGLVEQTAKLPASRIFRSKRSLRLSFKQKKQIGVLPPEGFTRFDETLSGTATVTLKRLR